MPILYINSGFRISKYNRYESFLLSPTFGIKYNPISDLAIKASIGKYSQFLYTINQEEEVLTGDEGGISAGYGGILIAEGGKIHENHTKLMEAMK